MEKQKNPEKEALLHPFLDANVLFDFLTGSGANMLNASKIIDLGRLGEVQLYVCVLTLVLLEAHFGSRKADIDSFFRELTTFTKITPLGEAEVGKVLHGSFSDFEDGLQYYSAYHGGSKVIITRDAKGFRPSEIPFIDPETYLKLFYAL